ncbi:hypothetical protein RYB01_20005 [Pseudomonas syringae]|nr:hypothetical protein [Pseudomonas syringae]
MASSVGADLIASPSHDQSPPLQEFRFVAHLSFNGGVFPSG